MEDLGFVHLRVHTAFSLLEGAIQLKDALKLAKADGQPAFAIADTGNLFGALEFSEKASGSGLQPIIGCQVAVVFDDEPERRGNRIEALPSVVMIAANETGYRNLVHLVSRSFMETDASMKAHVAARDLAANSEGIIVLTGGPGGPVDRMLAEGYAEIAESRLRFLADVYGDRLYVELQRHDLDSERRVEPLIVDLAYAMDLPLVATNEVFFATRDDYEAHDALICIAESRMVAEEDRRRLTPEHYFKSRKEMRELFADLPEAIDNTVEIARRCSWRPHTLRPILPRFTGEDGEAGEKAEAAELRRQAIAGLERRIALQGMAPGASEEDYRKRLDYELSIIEGMKFPGYFLIVSDFIKWAKSQDIPVGPGRGSGAGSLVAYSLTITDLDPLRFKLLFERFLNPERVSMPDFDIDFCQDRRDEVIHYVQEKYGRDQVAQIITFGSLQARAVMRDVGRVLQMPYGQVDKLAKLVPSNPANPTPLHKAIDEEPRLQEAAREEEIVERLFSIATRLEGLFRHASTHAAGIVIGDRPLDELVPLYRDPRSDMPVTQFNMKWVEPAGLVKFDFLGLKTLTVLDKAVKLIRRKGVDIDLSQVPLDDPATYALLARGETLGVFQLESQGMRKALAGMKPDRFEDIIALVALYRPGPMDNIPTYNRRKHGLEEPEYPHPKLEPILSETYGVIIYQEQVMQVAQELSGYSLGEADLLRRAMGKKIKEEMAKQRVRFVDGAVRNGIDKNQANTIFDLLAKFADYGFNKSHAAAYALVAYLTAYLKANHPVEFLAGTMTLDMGNTDKLNDFRREAMRLGIEVLPPSVNRSMVPFEVDDGRIVYSLAALKGVGHGVVDHLVDVRGETGFKDISDFARKINPRLVNKRTLECIVAAGGFDDLEPNRRSIAEGLDRIVAEAARVRQDEDSGQNELFGGPDGGVEVRLPDVPEWTMEDKLQREMNAVGFYLSAHPLDSYRPMFAKLRVQLWTEFSESVKRGAAVGRLIGTVTQKQERRTRNGNKMGILNISDPSGQYEAVVFSETLNEYRDQLEPGKSLVLLVAAEERDETISVRIQSVEPLERVANGLHKNLRVFLRDSGPVESIASQLKKAGDGKVSLVMTLDEQRREVEVELPGGYQVSPLIANALRSVRGVVQVDLS